MNLPVWLHIINDDLAAAAYQGDPGLLDLSGRKTLEDGFSSRNANVNNMGSGVPERGQ